MSLSNAGRQIDGGEKRDREMNEGGERTNGTGEVGRSGEKGRWVSGVQSKMRRLGGPEMEMKGGRRGRER